MTDQDFHIKVLTWNLAKGIGDLGEIAKRIEQSNVDVCCFQETNGKVEEAIGRRFNPRIIHSDDPLSTDLPSDSTSEWTLVVPSGKQGWIRNSLLTRLPINKLSRIDLPHEVRDALLCQVEINIGKKNQTKITCTIINLHLTAGREKTKEREEQLQCLLDQLDLDANYLILGDYNLARDEHVWPPKNFETFPLVDTYCYTNPMNQGQPFHYRHPFDRCLYRGFLQIGGDPIILGHDFKASDHFGVIFPVKIDKGTGKKVKESKGKSTTMAIPLSEPVKKPDKEKTEKNKSDKIKISKNKTPKDQKKKKERPSSTIIPIRIESPQTVTSNHPTISNNPFTSNPPVISNRTISSPNPVILPPIITGTTKRESKLSKPIELEFTEKLLDLSEIKRVG